METDARIDRCRANGGAVLCVNASGKEVTFDIGGGQITNCTAADGLLYVSAGTLNISSDLIGDQANGKDGTLGSNFTGCSVTKKAGLVYLSGGTLNMNCPRS